MKISVITAACNQGRFLAETIDAAIGGLIGAKDWEFIVADDCSEDGSCDNLETSKPRTRVVRTPKRSGCSFSRNFAGKHTTGDVIISVDPHCYFQSGCLYEMAKLALDRNGIVMPLVHWEARHKDIYGGSLGIQSRGIRNTRPMKRPTRRPTLHGTIYVMQRSVYEKLNGWPVLPGRWGWWEQTTSVWLYRLGMRGYVFPQFYCRHRHYRVQNKFPFELHDREIIENGDWFHAMCFPKTYEGTWKPLLQKKYGPHEVTLVGTDKFNETQAWLNENSVLSEDDILRDVVKCRDLEKHPVIKALRKWQKRQKWQKWQKRQMRRR